MKRTGRGHDFKATRSNWLTGKKETRYVEVKTGGAKLSPLQKRKKRSLGKKYVVKGDPMFSFGSPSKGRFKKSAGSGLFGSTKSRRSRAPKWTI